MTIDASLLALITTAGLAILSTYLHKQYIKAKTIIKQLSKLLDTISKAIEDDKVTTEEIQQIVSQCKALIKDIEGDDEQRKR